MPILLVELDVSGIALHVVLAKLNPKAQEEQLKDEVQAEHPLGHLAHTVLLSS